MIVTENGCSDTSNCVYFEAWGIDELVDYHIQVYPNPSDDEITIHFGELMGEKVITIFNEIGQRVIEADPSILNHQLIDISRLKSGMYYLVVASEGTIKSREKLIVID